MLGSARVPKNAKPRAARKRKSPYLPKKVPTQARAIETFDSLVAATARVLERRGYAELTTNHVARAAGVAIGSLYEYFPSKDALVAEVVRRTLADIAGELSRAFADALAKGLDKTLASWIDAAFTAVSARGKLMRVLWMEVPFVWELDEVKNLSTLLTAITRTGTPGARQAWILRDVEASAYLLTIMVRAAVIESVVLRPDTLTLGQTRDTLTAMLTALLVPAECQQPA